MSIPLLAGSFTSLSLYLLSFCPANGTLTLVDSRGNLGPHQYIALGHDKSRAYTTSWGDSILSVWDTQPLRHVKNLDIAAISSYISIPSPHTHVYSAGGPSGEVHTLSGTKTQQFSFVDDLEGADKSRKALRTGSHAVEFTPSGELAFIPVLGPPSRIEMFTRDISTGELTPVYTAKSPREEPDGPRHLKIHPNGRILYSVTEHSNFIDVYSIHPTSLSYITSRSIIPDSLRTEGVFRGDTLMLHPNGHSLFTTTRGTNPSTKGWMSIFAINADGLFDGQEERWETPTSGGKANAIDILSKSLKCDPEENEIWILLTDDSPQAVDDVIGGVRVLEWDGFETGGVKEVAKYPDGEGEMRGGSHAVWLV